MFSSLETVLVSNLDFFFSPSSHTLDKGRLGLIFSSGSSSFLFLVNKDKSLKEEVYGIVFNMKMTVCPQLLLHLFRTGEVDHRVVLVCRIIKCAANWY